MWFNEVNDMVWICVCFNDVGGVYSWVSGKVIRLGLIICREVGVVSREKVCESNEASKESLETVG